MSLHIQPETRGVSESTSPQQSSVWLQYHLGASNQYGQMSSQKTKRNQFAMKGSSKAPGSAILPKPEFNKSYSAIDLRPGTIALGRKTKSSHRSGSGSGLRMDDLWWIPSNKQETKFGVRPTTTSSNKRNALTPSNGINGSGLPLIRQGTGTSRKAQRSIQTAPSKKRPLGKTKQDNYLTFRPKSSYSLVQTQDNVPQSPGSDLSGNYMFIKVKNNPELLNVRTHYTHIHTRINLDDPLGLHTKHVKRINGANSASNENSCELESLTSLDSEQNLSEISNSSSVPDSLPAILTSKDSTVPASLRAVANVRDNTVINSLPTKDNAALHVSGTRLGNSNDKTDHTSKIRDSAEVDVKDDKHTDNKKYGSPMHGTQVQNAPEPVPQLQNDPQSPPEASNDSKPTSEMPDAPQPPSKVPDAPKSQGSNVPNVVSKAPDMQEATPQILDTPQSTSKIPDAPQLASQVPSHDPHKEGGDCQHSSITNPSLTTSNPLNHANPTNNTSTGDADDITKGDRHPDLNVDSNGIATTEKQQNEELKEVDEMKEEEHGITEVQEAEKESSFKEDTEAQAVTTEVQKNCTEGPAESEPQPVEPKALQTNLSKSEYFCVNVDADENHNVVDVPDENKVQENIDETAKENDLEPVTPILKVTVSNNISEQENWEKASVGSQDSKVSSKGSSKDSSGSQKPKRGVRFNDENVVHEFEPWKPINSPNPKIPEPNETEEGSGDQGLAPVSVDPESSETVITEEKDVDRGFAYVGEENSLVVKLPRSSTNADGEEIAYQEGENIIDKEKATRKESTGGVNEEQENLATGSSHKECVEKNVEDITEEEIDIKEADDDNVKGDENTESKNDGDTFVRESNDEENAGNKNATEEEESNSDEHIFTKQPDNDSDKQTLANDSDNGSAETNNQTEGDASSLSNCVGYESAEVHTPESQLSKDIAETIDQELSDAANNDENEQ